MYLICFVRSERHQKAYLGSTLYSLRFITDLQLRGAKDMC